ncbi:MAG: hypothetical protein M1551_00885, partial [Firmicutes bacterium]|nr:hypothetical protein [Bacillota bacterium]
LPLLQKLQVLDALEFSTPYNDQVLAFNEVARYLAGPGMHQPATLFYVGINKDSWNALPDDLKALLETTARSTTLWSWSKDLSESMKALEAFEEAGVNLVEVDEAVQRKLKEDTWALLDKRAQEQGGIFAETWQSIKDFRARFVDYEDFMMPIRIE